MKYEKGEFWMKNTGRGLYLCDPRHPRSVRFMRATTDCADFTDRLDCGFQYAPLQKRLQSNLVRPSPSKKIVWLS
jgi:hypothetical protein